jgi:uncharacterized protein YcbX
MRLGRVAEIWRYPVKSMAGERIASSHVGVCGLRADRGWAVRDDTTGEICSGRTRPILVQCSALYREPPGGDRVPHVDVFLPDGSAVASDSPDASRRLSELMGRRVTLQPLHPSSETAYYRRQEALAPLVARLWAWRPARRLVQRAMVRGRVAAKLRGEFGNEPSEALPDLSNVPPAMWEFYTPPGTYFDLFSIHLLTTSTLRRMSRVNPAADWDVRRFRPNLLLETDQPDASEANWTGRTIRVGHVALKAEIPTVRCAMTMQAQGTLRRDASVLRTIIRENDQRLGLYASVLAGGVIRIGDPVELDQVENPLGPKV